MPTNRKGYFRERDAKRKASGLCLRCTSAAVVGSDNCSTCREERNATMVRRNRRLREQALAAYGTSCECCGETDQGFLTIDHVNNDGSKQRKAQGVSSGTAFYAWLKKNGFPKNLGLRVLCMNCNAARQWFGECPHKTSEQVLLGKLSKVPLTY